MAKKKETSASPFVPVEEQPYPIPENWCWIRLGALLSEIKNGTTIKQDKSGDGYCVTRIESLQNQTIDFDRLGYIVNEEDIKNTDWYIAGDIALSHINSAEHVGKTALIRPDMLPLVHGMNLLRLRFYKHCIPTLFQYYSQSFQYKDEILSRINMAVNQVSINQKQICSMEFPLPPPPEQHRIVSRIESLFAKLDEAKEKAQTVVDGFELRKSAILHKAFSGELTERWRKEHGVGLDSWEIVQFGDLITSIEAGKNWLAEGRPPRNGEFGVVKVSAVTWGEFNEEESKTCTAPNQWNAETQIQEGDFLFSRANTLQLVGNCVIVRDISKRLMLSDKILRFTFFDEVMPWFVLYFTKSKHYRAQIEDLASGNQDGMRNISQKNLKHVKLPQPTLQEQKEIVRILDNLLAQVQQAKRVVETVLTQIDTMKKTILARAFRGELGTNNPAEESAMELLKTIL